MNVERDSNGYEHNGHCQSREAAHRNAPLFALCLASCRIREIHDGAGASRAVHGLFHRRHVDLQQFP
jgi:hypothetical protein